MTPAVAPRTPSLPPVSGPAGSAMVMHSANPDGYRAPLLARTHMRLGMWQAAISEVCGEAASGAPPVCPSICLPGTRGGIW